MRNSLLVFFVFLFCFLFIGAPSSEQSAQSEVAVKPASATVQVLTQRNLPLEFIPNAGQLDGRVRFVIKGSDRTLYFTPEGMTLALHKETKAPKPERGKVVAKLRDQKPVPAESWVVKMDFIGARKNVVPEGLDKTGAVFSYFKGNRENWHTGLPGYRQIIYHDLWPGVDMMFKGDVGKLKYEYIVKPGADSGQIQFGIRGASGVAVDGEGRLVVDSPLEKIIDEKPLVYQENESGDRTPVKAQYKIEKAASGNARVGFLLADYDRSLALVIDPATLVYCGYIGGSDYDVGYGIAVDGSGCAYITGATYSVETTFPVVGGPDLTYNGGYDAFVAKVNASGTALVYCGYIGGSSHDTGYGIAVDGSGCAYIAGYAGSDQTTFPVAVGPDLTHNGGYLDGFVAKVNSSGTGLVYCGYIGGLSSEACSGIVVDGSGNAYVSGTTESDETTFPIAVGPDLTFNGHAEAFVAKVKADGTGLGYCGYIGGSGYDYGNGIALDGSGSAYITGETSSDQTTFPVAVGPDLTHNGGSYDAFVAKVKADGTGLVYCGYIGGSGNDFGYDIVVDGSGSSYITGETSSDETTFPVIAGPDLTYNGDYHDGFVAKAKPDGTGLVYCGYIGGDRTDDGRGIAMDGSGSVYITGRTSSNETSFPVIVGPDLTYNGDYDAFVAKVKPDGTGLVYCGYIGGDWIDDGRGIAVDSSGSAYITGMTWSNETTFPVLVGPDLTYNGDFYDAFVAKVFSPLPEMFADISLSKGVSNIAPYVGDTVVFIVGVTNLGPDDATGVRVGDKLPPGLSLVSAVVTQGSYDSASGVWDVGSLGDGYAASLTLTARVDQEGPLVNQAALLGLDQTDTNEVNNRASVSLTAVYRVFPPVGFSLTRLENDLIFFKEYVNRLVWQANPENMMPIVKYRLYRKAKGQPDSAFALYREFDASTLGFDDRGLKQGDLFVYRLTSVNDRGRESDPVEAGN